MAGPSRGRGGKGNQGQHTEMAKIRHMIEDLSQVVKVL